MESIKNKFALYYFSYFFILKPINNNTSSMYNNNRPNANWLTSTDVNKKYYYEKSQKYYKPRGRSLNNDIDSRWENIYAQKDRQELYEIIHAGFKK